MSIYKKENGNLEKLAGGGNQLGTRLLYGGFPIVLGREINNNSNYYKTI